jgi:hypothetical protein
MVLVRNLETFPVAGTEKLLERIATREVADPNYGPPLEIGIFLAEIIEFAAAHVMHTELDGVPESCGLEINSHHQRPLRIVGPGR